MLLAAAFAMACGAVSIAFVAAHGGLQVPDARGGSGAVAIASPSPEAAAPTPAATLAPPSTPAPSSAPSPTPSPSLAVPSAAATPVPSLDPLAALPACPDHPGCYLYTVRRGDTLSTISDHWLIGLWLVEALNPEISDPSTIVVGQTIYLGRSPVVRLDPCPDTPGCYLYIVRSGDRLSTIAGRYGTTTSAILDLNPTLTDPNRIYSGQTIRLPGPA